MGEGAIVYNMFTMPAFKFLFMSSHKSGGIKSRELNQHEKNIFMKLIENSMVYRKKRRGRVSHHCYVPDIRSRNREQQTALEQCQNLPYK